MPNSVRWAASSGPTRTKRGRGMTFLREGLTMSGSSSEVGELPGSGVIELGCGWMLDPASDDWARSGREESCFAVWRISSLGPPMEFL